LVDPPWHLFYIFLCFSNTLSHDFLLLWTPREHCGSKNDFLLPHMFNGSHPITNRINKKFSIPTSIHNTIIFGPIDRSHDYFDILKMYFTSTILKSWKQTYNKHYARSRGWKIHQAINQALILTFINLFNLCQISSFY